jgi:hypothetical protein
VQDHLARFARPQGTASEAHASYRLMAGASYAPARLQALPRSRGAQDLIEHLRVLAEEEQQDMRDRRRASRFN